MMIQAGYVRSLFANLENGRTDAFFDHVAEDVNWTVMGTHPLAGTYHTKADFLTHTFGRLNKLLKEGVVLHVTNLLVDGDTAAVELESLSTALNGKPFDTRYCWVARFSNEIIVEVRAYLDSALVQRLIDENEHPPSMVFSAERSYSSERYPTP
jgi:ketosteroid isomerase-like protein